MTKHPVETAMRRAGPDDADALYGLALRTWVDTWAHTYHPRDLGSYLSTKMSPQSVRGWLTDTESATWFAESRGVPIGYVSAGPCTLPVPDRSPRAGELVRLYVVREAHGGGAGRRLLETALAWLDARYAPVYLSVWSENYGAQRLYERAGFRKAHEYKYVVGAQADDEWIMERRNDLQTDLR